MTSFNVNTARLLNFALFGTLGLATISTKMAGAAWLVLVMFGLIVTVRSRPLTAQTDAQITAQIWLWACAFALLLRAVPVEYWADPWEEQHGPLRLFLGALGIWGLAFSKTWNPTWALHGLAVAGVLALGQILLGGRAGLPTNAIPWAGGVGMISLLLLHSAALLAKRKLERWVWGVGAAAALTAVLFSETRGAYGAVLWAALWLIWHQRRRFTPKKLAIAALATMALLIGLRNTSLVQMPLNRITTAAAEFQSSQMRQEGSQNSSVGARVELWSLAAHSVPQSPWLGHGREERLSMIYKWGKDRHSATVTELGHMHNQYLHDLMDHGLWGLSSSLFYLLGLVSLSFWLIRKRASFAGWTLGSVAFIHASASLTNVNFAHNYYPTIMSIVVGLALLSATSKEIRISDP